MYTLVRRSLILQKGFSFINECTFVNQICICQKIEMSIRNPHQKVSLRVNSQSERSILQYTHKYHAMNHSHNIQVKGTEP